MADKAKNMVQEEEEEVEDAEKPGESSKRAWGGAMDGAAEHRTSKIGDPKSKHPHHRKKGGGIPGMGAKMRPDKRARGGATSDMNPTTAAGNMSQPSYQGKDTITNGEGSKGGDSKGKNG